MCVCLACVSGRRSPPLVTEQDLAEEDCTLLSNSIRERLLQIVGMRMNTTWRADPEPQDRGRVRSLIYSTDYDRFAIGSYRWRSTPWGTGLQIVIQQERAWGQSGGEDQRAGY
ncbi:hypothetical protein AAFF_G00110560 [Aldrovandia affinis]|uniref:Uncharacterized protein n=1 Tax=Aldrovandia affinis TaxID=143900 RepID=A0AAD7R0Z8_9TELE|nr:hypothetical protein AAFF_G00110560 [Aldrovandia affinis]